MHTLQLNNKYMNMNYWNCAKKKQIAKEIISLLGRTLYRYPRDQGSNPGKIEFLQS